MLRIRQQPFFRRFPSLWGSTSSSSPGRSLFLPTEKKVLGLRHRLHETPESYKIVIDAPGVKSSDIAIKKASDSSLLVSAKRSFPSSMQFEQPFLFNAKKVQPDSISAKYEDGVLTIDLPKDPSAGPAPVPIVNAYPPINDDAHVVVATVDVPGVRADDVRVTVQNNDTIVIHATRNDENSVFKLKKMFTLDDDVAAHSVEAYLKDGLLTIMAESPTERADTIQGTVLEPDSTLIPIQTSDQIPSDASDNVPIDEASADEQVQSSSTAPSEHVVEVGK